MTIIWLWPFHLTMTLPFDYGPSIWLWPFHLTKALQFDLRFKFFQKGKIISVNPDKFRLSTNYSLSKEGNTCLASNTDCSMSVTWLTHIAKTHWEFFSLRNTRVYNTWTVETWNVIVNYATDMKTENVIYY